MQKLFGSSISRRSLQRRAGTYTLKVYLGRSPISKEPIYWQESYETKAEAEAAYMQFLSEQCTQVA